MSVQSPSLTVSVTVEVPAAVQSSVGFGVVAPASIPDVATQRVRQRAGLAVGVVRRRS